MTINYQELKEKYGTPLYVFNENNIINIMREYKESFRSNYFKTDVLYASKALSILHIYKLCKEEGLYADVVSMGEIYTALKSGMNPTHLYFHGNNKQIEELEYAISNGVVHIVIDSYADYCHIERVASSLNKKVSCLIRLNTGVEAHTHKFIVTSHIDSKFGMLIDSEDLNKTLKGIENSKNVILEGFHSHIGSQIFEIEGFYAAIDKLVTYLKNFKEPMALNLGGGFGARYTKDDHPMAVRDIVGLIVKHTEEKLKENGVTISHLMIEPGRSIVCEAGTTLYTIGAVKHTPHREYYFIDGGMTDNIRPALYQAKYEGFIVGKEDSPKKIITVAGKCCESGDIIMEDTKLSEAGEGDLLVVKSTGAYGYSMFSNYNKALRPAVVFVSSSGDFLAVKRQTLEDIIRGEVSENI